MATKQFGSNDEGGSMSSGDCFKKAADLAMRLHNFDGDGVHIVHGLPVGQGVHNRNKRYWHAWVELDTLIWHPELERTIRIAQVLDYSNGLAVETSRGVYYLLSNLNENWVWRYEPQAASNLMLTTGHYGPWVEGWEGMSEA